jgi:hypothetical protein
MSLSVRTRFEVFKRDRFTCSYCGGHPPDILLECDHVVPRAAGGSDEMDNLVTACQDCNRGKSDRLLDEGDRPAVNARSVEGLEERLAQATAYVELLGQLSNVTDAMLNRVTEAWARAFGAKTQERDTGTVWVLDGGTWPKEATVRIFLRELDLEQILGAIDVAASRIGPSAGNDRYFYAICWRMVRDKRAEPQGAADDERLLQLSIENGRLKDELGKAKELIHDLQINVRRLREEAGRE